MMTFVGVCSDSLTGLRVPLSATGKSAPLIPAAMSLGQKLAVERLYSALKIALWPR